MKSWRTLAQLLSRGHKLSLKPCKMTKMVTKVLLIRSSASLVSVFTQVLSCQIMSKYSHASPVLLKVSSGSQTAQAHSKSQMLTILISNVELVS